MTTPILGEWASTHAKLGIPVFPCEPQGTEPLTPHGYEDASTDPAQLAEWWERWPDANVAMPTGNRYGVFDVLESIYSETNDGEFHTEDKIGDVWEIEDLAAGVYVCRPGTIESVRWMNYFGASDQSSDYRDRQGIRYHALDSWVLVPGSVTPDGKYKYDSPSDYSDHNPRPLNWDRCQAILEAEESGVETALKILSGHSVRLENVQRFTPNTLGRAKVYVGNVYMGDVLIDSGSVVGFVPAAEVVDAADAQQATQDVHVLVAGLEKLYDTRKSTTISAVRRDECKLFNMSSDRKDAAIHRAVMEGLVTKTSGPRNAWILVPASRQAEE
jgi:hypothetical protein